MIPQYRKTGKWIFYNNTCCNTGNDTMDAMAGKITWDIKRGSGNSAQKKWSLKFRMTYNAPSYLQVPHARIWRDDCDKDKGKQKFGGEVGIEAKM